MDRGKTPEWKIGAGKRLKGPKKETLEVAPQSVRSRGMSAGESEDGKKNLPSHNERVSKKMNCVGRRKRSEVSTDKRSNLQNGSAAICMERTASSHLTPGALALQNRGEPGLRLEISPQDNGLKSGGSAKAVKTRLLRAEKGKQA